MKIYSAFSLCGTFFIKIKDGNLYYKLIDNNKVPNNVCLVLYTDTDILNIKAFHDGRYLEDGFKLSVKDGEWVLENDKFVVKISQMTPFEYIDPSEFGLDKIYISDENKWNSPISPDEVKDIAAMYSNDKIKELIDQFDEKIKDIAHPEKEIYNFICSNIVCDSDYNLDAKIELGHLYIKDHNDTKWVSLYDFYKLSKLTEELKDENIILKKRIKKLESKETQFNNKGEVIW